MEQNDLVPHQNWHAEKWENSCEPPTQHTCCSPFWQEPQLLYFASLALRMAGRGRVSCRLQRMLHTCAGHMAEWMCVCGGGAEVLTPGLSIWCLYMQMIIDLHRTDSLLSLRDR